MIATLLPGRQESGKTIAVMALALAFCAMVSLSLRADLVVHFTFDDENEPGLDSSGNDYEGEVEGALWVEDDEREGALEFLGGNEGLVRVRELDELPGDDFTITFWAWRDPLTSTGGNDGLFQVQLGGEVPTTTPADKVIGAWVAGSAGVWGRLHQQDRTRMNLDANTFFMENEVWTHFAYRGDGELFEVVVDGEAGLGPAVPYDGTLDLHDTLFIGKQGGESWGGRLDDFRVYDHALTDEEIEMVMDEEGEVVPPPCPPEGDTHCLGLTVEGPDGDVTGTYVLEAEAKDDSGDTIRYMFVAEGEAGEMKEVGPQNQNTARFGLTEGTWTLSVTVDDSRSCDDEAADATCSTTVEVKAREPSPDDLQIHLTFDDDNDPGMDSSGNDLDGEVEGALWVDDDEREGSLEFSGGDDGFVRIRLFEEIPGDSFTITFWAYRDPLLSTSNNGGLFQVQLGGETPTANAADKVIGAWVAGSAGVWGRLHQLDRARMNLDANTFFMEDESWTHFAYRGNGELFEVVVNGETFEVVVNSESGIGPSIPYDGTLDAHDALFIGKQGGESWGGRIDDFRVYSRALDDEEIELIMDGEDPTPDAPQFLRGDADANGSLQITDAISALSFLFAGTFSPTCMDALDWNDNGSVEIADPIGNLGRQFAGGDPAPPPGSDDCGTDPTDDELDCEGFAACL